jgi:predicted phage terminase large subunit-like protein
MEGYERDVRIAEKIKRAVINNLMDIVPYQDLFEHIRQMLEDGEHDIVKKRTRFAHQCNDWLLGQTEMMIRLASPEEAGPFYDQWRKCMVVASTYDFDRYLQYVEIDKPRAKRFYLPRRHYLRPITAAYQEVADGKLDLLTISLPKRAGKSQMGINFILWISGQKPNNSTLMEGTGDDLVKSFYDGCLEYLEQPSDYLYYDVFPRAPLVQTNADRKTLNLDKKSRFPTIMCRSIDSRQVGLSEATNVLYLDDCVEGREEAQNRQRLEAKWEVISGDIMGRAIEGTPMVFCGTRYSLYDPIGKVQDYARSEGLRWKALEIPALDPVTDESNFEYEREGRPVFTTAYFRAQRDLLSAEQWESEFQQEPFEAKGLTFPKDDLNYFYELPRDVDPDSIIAVADTAEKGSDSTAMPVAYIYGEDVYIVDVVFDNSPPAVTQPQCARKIIDHGVQNVTFEANNAGSYYGKDVVELCRAEGYRVGLRSKRTISNKQTRIEMASSNIIKHFWFKHPSTYKPTSQYAAFMRELTTYTRTGKVPHDDAPDSLSLLENETRRAVSGGVEVVKRMF